MNTTTHESGLTMLTENKADFGEAIKRDPSLSAFTFDGPYQVTSAHDLLDNMYCADNGRYYETPVDWYGLARSFGQSPCAVF